MRPSKILVLIALLLLIPAKGYAQCEAYWIDLGRNGDEEPLRLRTGWPLAQFTNNFPHWDPARYDVNGRYAGKASKSELQWYPTETPATVEAIGRVGGHAVSAITYWEAEGWKGAVPVGQVGTLRMTYKVDGNRLVAESASFLSEEAGKSCGQYPQ